MKDTIIIHTLDVRPDWMQGRPVQEKVAEVGRWHVQERGWSAIGYAMVIDRDGARGKGRDMDKDGDVYEETGAQAKGWNKRSIGIALVGGYGGARNDRFSKHYTEAQRAALWDTIDEIEARYGKMKIIGHNEVSSKDCPCFIVSDFIAAGRPSPAPKPNWLAALIAAILKLFGGK
jgi:hypothetical protein